jgi:hypothetical protein
MSLLDELVNGMVELVETVCRLNFVVVAFPHESNEFLYSVGFLFARLVLVSRRLRILLSPYRPKSHVIISFHAWLNFVLKEKSYCRLYYEYTRSPIAEVTY